MKFRGFDAFFRHAVSARRMRFPDLIEARSFFPSLRASLLAAAVVTACVASASGQQPGQNAPGQSPTVPNQAPTTQTQTTGGVTTTTTSSQTTDSTGKTNQNVTSSVEFHHRGKKKTDDGEKVAQSKDTKKAARREMRNDALVGVDAKLPDRQLYDKAESAMKKGHYDVARLDLQTMLNTYPDSQYQMRAKLTIADSWYKEGGTAALTQAESEYRDFCVFFPNAPEAAEAQMRIGDIYFKEMDKPDRDYAKALHAEEEYRRMITDYPDSKLLPQAKQRLREVQEVLATREAGIASFYATRDNYSAVIARDQTIIDLYPLYSHIDDVYISEGDAWEAQARFVRGVKGLSEAARARLLATYDARAAEAYRTVVLDHAAAPHVEDAKDRLSGMNLPIPTPTPDQVAASEALENSRKTYKVSDRAALFLLHRPDTVLAAQLGDPSLTDPKITTAPGVQSRVQDDFRAAINPNAPVEHAAPSAVDAASDGASAPGTATTAPAASAPLALTDVGDTSASPATEMTPAPAATTGGGNSVGVEILTPGTSAVTGAASTGVAGSGGTAAGATPTGGTPTALRESASPATLPAAEGTADPNYGLKAVGPANATPLPAAERAGAAPDRPNEITTTTPAAAVAPAKGKAKPAFDKSEESSSKHKKKKGIKKVVEPF